MTRAATLEALESPYVEMAAWKGVPRWAFSCKHALPNACRPRSRWSASRSYASPEGIVLVEEVFDFPGIGQASSTQ